jgi:cell division GTPase FtsZ
MSMLDILRLVGYTTGTGLYFFLVRLLLRRRARSETEWTILLLGVSTGLWHLGKMLRALDATRGAISNPLLEETSVNGAKGVLINITGGRDLTLFEVDKSVSLVQESAHEDANILFGAVIDDSMSAEVKVTVIATGFERVVAEVVAPAPPTNVRAISAAQSVMGSLPAAEPAKPPVELDVPTFIRRKAD